MAYAPADYFDDSEDDEDFGFLDDDSYMEFKKSMKQRNLQDYHASKPVDQKLLAKQSVFSHISARRYDDLIQELDKGFDINSELQNGCTPLLLACTTSSLQIVQELINRGCNVEAENDGSNALLIACNRVPDTAAPEGEPDMQTLSIVEILIEKGLDPNSIDRKRRRPIMLAAYRGHLEVVKYLLPLSEKDAEDNQRWTALFWAVEGNNIEIVKLLLEEGYRTDKIDLRDNTVMDLVNFNGNEDILKLFPEDPSNNKYFIYMANNPFQFEQEFQNQNNPRLFSQVCNILYGAKSESTIPFFDAQNISLLDFLSVNDDKLREFGIVMPYQRKRILSGLFSFHKRPFQPRSIPFVSKNEIYCNIDVASVLLTTIIQMMSLEGSVRFMLNNRPENLTDAEKKELVEVLQRIKGTLKRIKPITNGLVRKTEQWDLSIRAMDKITKKRANVRWSYVFMLTTVFSAGLLFYGLRRLLP